jgi:hypothetical protein
MMVDAASNPGFPRFGRLSKFGTGLLFYEPWRDRRVFDCGDEGKRQVLPMTSLISDRAASSGNWQVRITF